MSVRPSSTKDRSCKRPCQVAGVERMVGSVVKARPISANPAKLRRKVPNQAGRMGGKLRRSPKAKRVIKSPLKTNAAVIIHPYRPSANPLGQSKVGARSGCHPRESIKSYLRIVRTMRTIPKNKGPIIPARAASLIQRVEFIWKHIIVAAQADQAMPEYIRSCAAQSAHRKFPR